MRGRIFSIVFPALTPFLAGCIGGGSEPPATVEDLGRRLASSDFQERWRTARELMCGGASSLTTLRNYLSREGSRLAPATRDALIETVDALRRQEFAAGIGVSPSLVASIPVDVDTHYETRLLHKKRIARDEPFHFRLILQKKFPEAPELAMHHFDAEWVWPQAENGEAKPSLRFLSDQIPSAMSTLGSGMETPFSGRVPLKEISRLFEGAPLDSPSTFGHPPKTIQLQLRFFAETTGPGAVAIRTGYRRTGFFPLEIENASKPILANDKSRYRAFCAEKFGENDPRLAQRDRMDSYAPLLYGPSELLEVLSVARHPASELALLEQLSAFASWTEADERVLARAIEGRAPYVRSLSWSIPINAAGFELEEIAPPASWRRLSQRALKAVLASDSPEESLAAARVLHRIRFRDAEVSGRIAALLKQFDADPRLAAHRDALLPMADRLLRSKEAAILVPFLDRRELLSPASLPAIHPLLTDRRVPHDIRICDAAAAALAAATGRKIGGLRDKDRPDRFGPVSARDQAIQTLKAWWEKKAVGN